MKQAAWPDVVIVTGPFINPRQRQPGLRPVWSYIGHDGSGRSQEPLPAKTPVSTISLAITTLAHLLALRIKSGSCTSACGLSRPEIPDPDKPLSLCADGVHGPLQQHPGAPPSTQAHTLLPRPIRCHAPLCSSQRVARPSTGTEKVVFSSQGIPSQWRHWDDELGGDASPWHDLSFSSGKLSTGPLSSCLACVSRRHI